MKPPMQKIIVPLERYMLMGIIVKTTLMFMGIIEENRADNIIRIVYGISFLP
jgi:hypothetical protein